MSEGEREGGRKEVKGGGGGDGKVWEVLWRGEKGEREGAGTRTSERVSEWLVLTLAGGLSGAEPLEGAGPRVR